MPSVTIKNLGIWFNLDSMRDRTFKRLIMRPFKRKQVEGFWAIQNIDLELKTGDILGISGPNGCGKSTLLRSITGIYSPDEGEIIVDGRVSLLALGAGFNRELSGLENIYLNGAIFGFSEDEIRELVDRIQDFAEIGQFIKEPIRTYSSGMVSRLGFAVAINLNPDILLIDEVFAVGDAAFQKKSRTAINEMINSKDRIVAIVSHDEKLLDSMCNRRLRMTKPER